MSSCYYLEMLPDEMLLEIFQYLSTADVLYSFFNLNSRFNRTISNSIHHINLTLSTYDQFDYICTIVLNEFNYCSTVRSLTISNNWIYLQAKTFLERFGSRISTM